MILAQQVMWQFQNRPSLNGDNNNLTTKESIANKK